MTLQLADRNSVPMDNEVRPKRSFSCWEEKEQENASAPVVKN